MIQCHDLRNRMDYRVRLKPKKRLTGKCQSNVKTCLVPNPTHLSVQSREFDWGVLSHGRRKRDRYLRLFLRLGLQILCLRMGRLSAEEKSERPRLHHCEIRLHAVILHCYVASHRCVKCVSSHCHLSHPRREILHHDVNHR